MSAKPTPAKPTGREPTGTEPTGTEPTGANTGTPGLPPLIVKICGITRPEDAAAATDAGADWLGLNFWPGSKRAVVPARDSASQGQGGDQDGRWALARDIAAAARAQAARLGRSVDLVGVFVDQPEDEIVAAALAVGLDRVQLHGEESLALCQALRARGLRVIKAVGLSGLADVSRAVTYANQADLDFVLADTPSPGHGGSGRSFDWTLAHKLMGSAQGRRWGVILAGGLRPDNVAAAIARVEPHGVDVASGVESAPGIKDMAKMTAFVRFAREPRQERLTKAMSNAMGKATGQGQGRPGRFGMYGGQFVAETLMPAVVELAEAYAKARVDREFQDELDSYLAEYVGRPCPLTFAPRLSSEVGAKVYLKREDLNHTGAHKINNCLGQALLARRMGKERLIAETGAGQHGVATATVAAMLGMPCDVYMGAEDVARQSLNVFRMKLLGARVIPVHAGTRTLKDAMNEALRDWVTNVEGTHYLIGSVAGPHPYPAMVRDFQSVIGREARAQCLARIGRLPDALVACVGGGSNAAGLFAPFVDDAGVAMYGVEAAGQGLDSERHAATLSRGRVGVLHGARSYVLCDPGGQITEAHSISAGLDYPGVGPEHAFWKDTGRVSYLTRTDSEALAGLQLLARTEGILCALETAHAVAALAEVAAAVGQGGVVVLCVSGRGDKDMITVARHLGVALGLDPDHEPPAEPRGGQP